ncbi:hypothetical protein Plhal703r1_c22g0093881 [Plasmopara halstedii]
MFRLQLHSSFSLRYQSRMICMCGYYSNLSSFQFRFAISPQNDEHYNFGHAYALTIYCAIHADDAESLLVVRFNDLNLKI